MAAKRWALVAELGAELARRAAVATVVKVAYHITPLLGGARRADVAAVAAL